MKIKTLLKLERAKGFELVSQSPQPFQGQGSTETSKTQHAQIRAQILGELGLDLSQVVLAWPQLPPQLKAAVLAIVGSVNSLPEVKP
jgi:hypothetical protein